MFSALLGILVSQARVGVACEGSNPLYVRRVRGCEWSHDLNR